MINIFNTKTNKSSLNCLITRKSRFGSLSYLVYLFLYVLLTPFILSKIEYFPDLANYSRYIRTETSFTRFTNEPLSAWLMSIVSSAYQYYLITWFIASIILFLLPLFYGKRYFIYSVFILLNPFSIILYQTPRQFLAYVIFCFLIITISKYRFTLLFLPLFLHTISGFLSFFLLFLLKFKKIFFSIFLMIGLIGLYIAMIQFYAFYTHESDDIQRGVGRFLLFLINILVILFVSYKKKFSEYYFVLFILLFSVGSYLITPFSGRIIPFLIPILLLYLMSSFNKKDSIFVIHLLLISQILLSTYIVINGSFGYE